MESQNMHFLSFKTMADTGLMPEALLFLKHRDLSNGELTPNRRQTRFLR
ncbi:MAG: hypothetical protein R3C05_08250 [Pirellulaceae bacterium]